MKIWPFNKTAPTILLDEESLDRAIRAGVQFPLDWFLAQPPEVQETIAARRDHWLEDLVVAAGYAVMDPERTLLSLQAEDGDKGAEEILANMNVQAIAEAMGHHASAEADREPPRRRSLSMGGTGERRAEAAAKVEAGRRKSEFFGGSDSKAGVERPQGYSKVGDVG